MNVLKAIERGVEAAKQASQPRRFQAGGKPIVCSHCGAENFEIPTRIGTTFTGFALQCFQCSHLVYFGKEPTALK